MPEKGKKSLTVNEQTHHEIGLAARQTRRTIQDFVDEIWNTYKSQDGSSSDKIIHFPDLADGLSDDDAWLLRQLASILHDRPQGDIFQLLETTLHKAIRAYTAADIHPPPLTPEPTIKGWTKGQWLRVAEEVLDSADSDLIDALTSNLKQFGKDARVLPPSIPTGARPRRRPKAG